MKSNQPYLLRAFFDWILDNGLTPYIVVNANLPGVEVPTQFVNDGQIVLNVSPSACVNFQMDLEQISFQARFSGQPMLVWLPCAAVGAIYAKENGAGTVFADAEELQKAYAESAGEENPEIASTPIVENKKQLSSVDSDSQNVTKKEDKKPSGKPTLTVIK
jgi:stringent starvation protein B